MNERSIQLDKVTTTYIIIVEFAHFTEILAHIDSTIRTDRNHLVTFMMNFHQTK